MQKLSFEQILNWLFIDLMYSRAHFVIVACLQDKRRAVIREMSPELFNLTVGAHADCSQIGVAKIFDRTSDASIHTLLSSALKETHLFQHGGGADVEKLVQDSTNILDSLAPAIKAIRTRRDKTMVHMDAVAINDPEKYVSAGFIRYSEFARVLEEVGGILNRFALLYRGKPVKLDLAEPKAYEGPLDLLAEVMQSRRAPTG